MKSVFITFDQAFYERIFGICSTVKTVVGSAIGSKYRDVEVSRASLITAVMHGRVCVRLLLLLWMMRK